MHIFFTSVDVYEYARIYACYLYVTQTECRLCSSLTGSFAMDLLSAI